MADSVKHGKSKIGAECARSIDAAKLDAQIWAKTWAFISNPEELRAEVEKRIAVLPQRQADATDEMDRLSHKSDSLMMERQ